MARNTMKLDVGGFEELAMKLKKLGGDVQSVVTDALEQAGDTIEWDTKEAVAKAHLPAKGKYSKGDTEKSIVSQPKVTWSGGVASIGVGFDYGKDGAGGYLITGTPRMKPDQALLRMYKRKKYMAKISAEMQEIVVDAIGEIMED